MTAPYRPDFVEVIDDTKRGGPRLHGRCPHCNEVIAVHAAHAASACPLCERAFPLLDILPLTRSRS